MYSTLLLVLSNSKRKLLWCIMATIYLMFVHKDLLYCISIIHPAPSLQAVHRYSFDAAVSFLWHYVAITTIGICYTYPEHVETGLFYLAIPLLLGGTGCVDDFHLKSSV